MNLNIEALDISSPSALPRRKNLTFLRRLSKTLSFDSKDTFVKRFNEEMSNKTKSLANLFRSDTNLSSTSNHVDYLGAPPHIGRRRSYSSPSAEEERDHFPYTGLMPAPSPRSPTSRHRALKKLKEQAKQETNLMVLKLAKTEQQLHEAQEKNKVLTNKLLEKNEQIDSAKNQIDHLTDKLDREMQCSADLYQKVKEMEHELKKLKTNPTCNSINVFVDRNDNEFPANIPTCDGADDLHNFKKSVTPIGDLMLCCTLCNERITIEDMESHSSKCSSGSSKKQKNGKKDHTILPSAGILVATVTSSKLDSSDFNGPFKVICKTTIPEYKKTLLNSERTKEDFVWFRKALEEFHPERIIPPLNFQEDLSYNIREIQRFLSRICYHKILRGDTLVRRFFCATNKEFEALKKSFKKQVLSLLNQKKPAIEVVDKDGLLYTTQVYVSQLIENLSSLINFFKSNNDGKKVVDGISDCFDALCKSEYHETYLKSVSRCLSHIIGELENKKNVLYDESALAEDLESILEFVKSADELLYRVECSVNTFLYWEEEIRVFEEMKSEGLVTSTNGKNITQLWAEASSNCFIAKDELEKLCRGLSDELSDFDIRKEQELKQIFIEYAQTRCDVFEKMQSKWFGVKLMLDADIVPSVRAVAFSSYE